MYLLEVVYYWKTKKQKVTSKSSCEAELRSMSMATSEVAWIVGLLQDLKQFVTHPLSLFCDKTSAEYIARNEAFHERTKHLKLDCYYVRENIDSEMIDTKYVRSRSQLADILTKSLHISQHWFLAFKLGLVSLNQVQIGEGM